MSGQSKQFRRGWIYEGLAQYLLARFAFVARPVTVGDDVGIDFLCTTFLESKDGKVLSPRNAFAIQIKGRADMKSKHWRLDLTDKFAYLRGLEQPFFIGVVDREALTMDIHSGEFLPPFFAFRGSVDKFRAHLAERASYSTGGPADRDHLVCFPHVGRLEAGMSDEDVARFCERFSELCGEMSLNIARRSNREYRFLVREPDGTRRWEYIVGPDSQRTIRPDVLHRIGELFLNMAEVIRQDPASFDRDEFQVYVDLVARLRARGQAIPDEVAELQALVEERLSSTW
jgi:hypothetical protein